MIGVDFQGRYYGSALGRFSSPDPSALAFADPTNPQSFNLYSYGWNNPLVNTDPTGMSCVDTSNGKADDGDGQGCAAAGVSPSTQDQRDKGQDIQNPQHADVTGQNPSDLEYWTTISTHEIPRYDPNDLPLDDGANAIIHKVFDNIAGFPAICSGGTFGYLGVQGSLGKTGKHGFAGGLGSMDSRSGGSVSALGEVSGNSAGGAAASGKQGTEGLVFVPFAEAAGGLAGVSKDGLALGVYVGTPERFPVGGGGGAYVNVTTLKSCQNVY
jgi:RHS repeat-associated protein